MSFEYPSTITARKEKKKAEEKKKAQEKENAYIKAVEPVFKKKEGIKQDIAINQLDDALSSKNIGDKLLSPKSVKKVADAAADDNQLGNTERKYQRDLFKKGGSAQIKGWGKARRR